MAMAIPNELQTLAQVASEIDESETKLTFANQCIKAQETLTNKLKDEIQRRKEICNCKKSENFKLEAEIRNAELEIEKITYKAIKTNNTEMKKDLLLTKEKKLELTERMQKGEKKYQDLWTQCKERYDGIPLIKTFNSHKNKCDELKNIINVIETDSKNINKTIKTKKEELAEKDRKQVVSLAEYIVHEAPAVVQNIKEKSAMMKQLFKEIDEITHDIKAKEAEVVNENIAQEAKVPQPEERKVSKNAWTIDNTLMMPKLQLPSVDMDLCVKLDINKVTLYTSPVKRTISLTELEKNTVKKSKPDEILKDNYISCYFNKNTADEGETKKEDSTVNYSKMKLINIIEDIKIDDSETYKLVANTNIDKFQEVEVITAGRKAQDFIKSAKNLQTMEIEEVEEVEMTNNQQEFLNPSTQYQDPSLVKRRDILDCEKPTEAVHHEIQAEIHVDSVKTTSGLSQRQSNLSELKDDRKKVSFDLSTQMLDESDKTKEVTPNTTITSQLDLSDVTDDNYMAIKDMILKKKHQLDLSPQFVYAKNSLQKKNEEQIITSKFFNEDKNDFEDNITMENKNSSNEKHQNLEEAQESGVVNKSPEEKIVSMDVDNAVSSPEAENPDKPVSGLLFTHGPQGVTDLDISMSTTGYDDGDPDFPTCLDSSLLLSPKADIPPMSGNSEVGSQDLPSFLTGFRKAGLSFFKQNPVDANPDTDKQNSENNFNFNFGSEDKKARGSLFSFFR